MQIYKITNLKNNKIYIGQDSKDDPNYFGSGNIIRKAIKKHGKINFKKEILEELSKTEDMSFNRTWLNEKEMYWIEKLQSYNRKIGYNLTKGGNGTFGNIRSKESKLKVTGENNPFFGKKHSDETKRILSSKRIGGKPTRTRKVAQIDLITEKIVKVFDSITNALRSLNINTYSGSNISKCCDGRIGFAYGFKWKYFEE